jgi:hypothetical protein
MFRTKRKPCISSADAHSVEVMKKSLLVIAFGLAVGYVLGARAGREQYDALVDRANGIWRDPRVARARREAARYAREQAPVIRERAETIAKAAPSVIADGARATASVAKGAAKDVADRTAGAAKDARDRTVAAAADVAGRVGEARDNALEDAIDDDERA